MSPTPKNQKDEHDNDDLDGCDLDFDVTPDEQVKKLLLPRDRKTTFSEKEWRERQKHGT